jgi:hypothetical protein
MGLTIHYTIRFRPCDRATACDLVNRAHIRAHEPKPHRVAVDARPSTSDPVKLERWASAWIMQNDPESPDTVRGISVPPIEGCIFPVVMGEGCEPLWLGLCRYPAKLRHEGHDIMTKLGSGWRFSGACKTQYASLHGWEHFRRRHTTVIALLRDWSELGARVRIIDEGGWWPRRSDAALRKAIATMNQTVAALAGALKDASGDDNADKIVAPIFAHPEFEHLEAEGLARNESAIKDAAKLIARLPTN